MLKVKNIQEWNKLSKMFNEISDSYYRFPMKYKKELERNFNIDSGTDYANYIFAIGNIEY